MSLPLVCTLAGDGTTDRSLRAVLEWVIRQNSILHNRGFVVQVAAPGAKLRERVLRALKDYPCDILFIHRDAEREPREKRLDEIRRAASAAGVSAFVPVVPVRMTEAWLLIDETAIRRAAGNPNGKIPLRLPKVEKLESMAHPKELLRECLMQASEKTGRRLKQFERDLPERAERVAELVADFSPLRQLSAFQAFEFDACEVLTRLLA